MRLAMLLVGVAAGVAAPGAARAQTAAAPVRWVVVAEGSEARYRIREQLAGLRFPNDAVGVTPAIEGAIVMEGNRVVAAESKVTVDLRQLKSDQERRDRFVQGRTLETATYPTVTFVPTGATGLPPTLPDSGSVSFTLTGSLTVKSVTRPVSWRVTLNLFGQEATGGATTSFTFDDFQMTKPRVASVLSVEDTIRLEFDFTLRRQ